MQDTNYLIRQLPLKDMGESLLTMEIINRAEYMNIDGPIKMAIRLAAFLHRDQRRSNRGSLPRDTYITHPLRNTLRLMRWGVTDMNILIAAVLHDTVEDCAEELVNQIAIFTMAGTTPAYYRAAAIRYLGFEFGDEVAALVEAVSNQLPEPGAPKLSKVEKRAEYRKNVAAETKNPKAAVVKLTDLIDNGSGLKHNTGMVDAARWHLANKYVGTMEDFLLRLRQPDMIILLSPAGFDQAQTAVVNGIADLHDLIKELEVADFE
jgi:(p)ppGpp synthase/HD superfamily hydrolase